MPTLAGTAITPTGSFKADYTGRKIAQLSPYRLGDDLVTHLGKHLLTHVVSRGIYLLLGFGLSA